tara:strand:- start:43 stop:405 length:363 start_codon:yes stop_codon:yes gene_type:complete
MKKRIGITLGLFFISAAILIFRPVPIVAEEEAIVVEGEVSAIYESGVKDISILLKNNSTLFYLNRGLELGLDIQELREKLLHQKVTIKYPEYWTPLDWNNRIRHLSKLEWKEGVIFNELK